MNRNITSPKRVSLFAWIGILLICTGCVTPFNTRVPQVVNRPPELERREAQVHDPYPDATFGPDTGFRPLGFSEQRSEPQRAKDRFFTAMLRTKNGNPFGPQTMQPQTGLPQAMMPYSRRPQVSNPHLTGAQPVMASAPASGNFYPQAMVQPTYQPQIATVQAPSQTALPVAPPAYYPSNYR